MFFVSKLGLQTPAPSQSEVVSKSMLGQLEQYEIVKGQIRQQYYSSIEEKVKNDWYKTKIAIYCPQGSGTLRQQSLMMH